MAELDLIKQLFLSLKYLCVLLRLSSCGQDFVVCVLILTSVYHMIVLMAKKDSNNLIISLFSCPEFKLHDHEPHTYFNELIFGGEWRMGHT